MIIQGAIKFTLLSLQLIYGRGNIAELKLIATRVSADLWKECSVRLIVAQMKNQEITEFGTRDPPIKSAASGKLNLPFFAEVQIRSCMMI